METPTDLAEERLDGLERQGHWRYKICQKTPNAICAEYISIGSGRYITGLARIGIETHFRLRHPLSGVSDSMSVAVTTASWADALPMTRLLFAAPISLAG